MFTRAVLTGLTLGILQLFIITPAVYADGWYVSDSEIHLQEPNQKAVIYWDGDRETMFISSSLKSDTISNFAWIVPLQSSTKPIVEAGNIEIFKDVVGFFAKPEDTNNLNSMRLKSGGIDEVQVVETKQIDIYDVAILKTTDSSALINWLNQNGYKIPDDMKPFLDEYIQKKNVYFIANKINLRNKYSKQIDEINTQYQQKVSEYKTICDKVTQLYYDNGIDNTIYHFDYKENANWNMEKDPCFLAQTFQNTGRSVFEILDKYLNDILLEAFRDNGIQKDMNIDLGNGLSIKSTELRIGTFTNSQYEKSSPNLLSYNYGNYGHSLWLTKDGKQLSDFDLNRYTMDSKIAGIQNPQNQVSYINSGSIKLSEEDKPIMLSFFSLNGPGYELFKADLNRRYALVNQTIEPIVMKLRAAFGTQLQDLENHNNDVFYYTQENKSGDTFLDKLNSIYFGSSSDGSNPQQKYGELYTVVMDLHNGLATPLKYQFQPDLPFYPLSLSRLNSGITNIEVYFLGNTKQTDLKSILSVDESKTITVDLSEKLRKYINPLDATYITRLTYKGESKGLVSDAEFPTNGIKSSLIQSFLRFFQMIWLNTIQIFRIKSL